MNIESFFKISYGLYLVSTKHNEKLNGYIANTVFQITAEPASFAISCNKDNLSSKLIKASGKFAFSILEHNVNQTIISRFGYKSGNDINKFEGIEHIFGKLDIPIVKQGSIAYFECELTQTVDVGTHLLFIGDLVHNEMLDGSKEPLTYSNYHKIRNMKSPKNAPTYIKPEAKKEAKEEEIKTKDSKLTKYECIICGHIYDPAIGDKDSNIAPGTPFEDLPDDWVCPDCGAEKSDFEPLN